jgi:type VI protein secretion system component VasK
LDSGEGLTKAKNHSRKRTIMARLPSEEQPTAAGDDVRVQEAGAGKPSEEEEVKEEEAEVKGIKMSEVEQHTSLDDLWLVIDGREGDGDQTAVQRRGSNFMGQHFLKIARSRCTFRVKICF